MIEDERAPEQERTYCRAPDPLRAELAEAESGAPTAVEGRPIGEGLPATGEPPRLCPDEPELAATAPAGDTTPVGELLGQLAESVASLGQRLAAVEEQLTAAARQVSFLPPQVRALAGKVDGLATSVAEPRVRAMLMGVLSVYDVADQLLRGGAEGEPTADRRPLEAIRSQLIQLLEASDLVETPCDGPFDPTMHCAVKVEPCDDPGLDGRICTVLRPGFGNEHATLRFAEVSVWRCAPPGDRPSRSPTEAGAAESTGLNGHQTACDGNGDRPSRSPGEGD